MKTGLTVASERAAIEKLAINTIRTLCMYAVLGEPSVKLDDLKKFRQLDSKCPGHPEYRWTSGVETTTGPLGQGLATSVGMALASRWAAATFNRPGFEMFDFDVYALCGDGCIMEGISAEAAQGENVEVE